MGVGTHALTVHKILANNYEARTEMYMGKKHLVVPVVMMVEGVHCGSAGPLFNSIEELGKYPATWNGIPVSIQHPEQDGQYISANSPDVLEKQTVGQVFNTHVDGKKLKAECWIDQERLLEISPEALEYLQNKRPLDVSIGVFSDDIPTEGDWNGEHYIAIATNYRPDHLALLPGGEGACSWKDGAGIRANAKQKEVDMSSQIQELKKKGFGITIHKWNEGYRELIDKCQRVLNSYDTNSTLHFLTEVFESYIIYETVPIEMNGGNSSFFKRGYEYRNGQVTFADAVVEVQRKTVYDEVKVNKYRRKEGGTMNKQEKINVLISSKVFKEEERPLLDTMEGAVLDKMVTMSSMKKEEPTDVTKIPVTTPVDLTIDVSKFSVAGLTKALSESFKTPDQYLEIMPAEIRDQMKAGLVLHRKRREELVKKLTSYANNPFSAEELNSKSMEELTKLSQMVPELVSDYSMAGARSGGAVTEEMVLLPVGIIPAVDKK